MTEAPEKKPFAWLETAAAILMAVSSLGTALCSFQVSRWGALSSEKNTQDPFKNAGAPLHPFVPSLYEMRYAREIDEALRTSAIQAEEARVTGGISTNYLNTTVLLATVLFFVGITSRLTSPRVRLGTFCFGVILFLLAAARVSMLPWRF